MTASMAASHALHTRSTPTKRVRGSSVHAGTMTLGPQEIAQLRTALQDAVVKCSERCLYQSSKW